MTVTTPATVIHVAGTVLFHGFGQNRTSVAPLLQQELPNWPTILGRA